VPLRLEFVQRFALGVAQPLWLHPVSTVFSHGSPGELELRYTYRSLHRKVGRGSNVGLKFALGRDKAVANATAVTG
jgi:hypothetical protein